VVPESIPERIIRRLNLAPVPLVHTHLALLLARAVLEASKAGVFEALSATALTAPEVAARCAMDGKATGKLLGALATSGYLTYEPAEGGRFGLTPMARKWMLPSSSVSLHDKMLFTFFEERLIGQMGQYLHTGKDVSGGSHVGAGTDKQFWASYQRAMRSVASVSADEVARRTYVPQGARDMLDIGGSHGLYSVALCRRHPSLSSTILDLPEAIEHAAPILSAEGMGSRVVHHAGNVLQTDLGEARYDVVFISSLVHHFDESTNLDLMKRIARALRPGGAVTVQELIRRDSPTEGGKPGALLDLYFALTSESGTWSIKEIAKWQLAAGLSPRPAVQLRSMPGTAQQAAVK
jgi:2-polyprenyl-3-methyl-5-hydroxy-6-metoxy-1,4-benzoquinol methylase